MLFATLWSPLDFHLDSKNGCIDVNNILGIIFYVHVCDLQGNIVCTSWERSMKFMFKYLGYILPILVLNKRIGIIFVI